MKISKSTTRAMTLIEIICVTTVVSFLVLLMIVPFKHLHRNPPRLKSTNSNKNVGRAHGIYDAAGNFVVVERRPLTTTGP